jgi:hypothetical protein
MRDFQIKTDADHLLIRLKFFAKNRDKKEIDKRNLNPFPLPGDVGFILVTDPSPAREERAQELPHTDEDRDGQPPPEDRLRPRKQRMAMWELLYRLSVKLSGKTAENALSAETILARTIQPLRADSQKNKN